MGKVFISRTLSWIFIAVAFAIVVVALGAGNFGIDTDNRWGPFRTGILLLGLFAFAIPLGWKASGLIDRRFSNQQWVGSASSLLSRIRAKLAIKPKQQSSRPTSSDSISVNESSYVSTVERQVETPISAGAVRRTASFPFGSAARWAAVAIFIVVVELLYIWLVSAGHMTGWPETSEFYDWLADAFVKGQTALTIEPSPLLAELENPYSLEERRSRQIPYVGDASYFRGNYYLYWGPAPAVFLAVWKLATGNSVGDHQIVFVAVSGIFVFSLLILLYFRRRYYPTMPHWLLASSLVIVATAHPILWVLNWPNIHRAAIASGQAFLLAGLYMALPAMDGSRIQLWRLGLAGLLWVLAFGSRVTLIGAVAVLVIFTTISVLSREKSRRNWVVGAKRLFAFGLPFALGLFILGLYNNVRFGSFLETGFRYQLANDNNALMAQGKIFNLVYLPPNALYYSVAPLRTQSIFPFVKPNWEEIPPISSLVDRLDIPSVYRIQNATGLLFALPAIAFAGYVAFQVLSGAMPLKRLEKGSTESEQGVDSYRQLNRILGVLIIAGICAVVPSLFYFWVADRFMLDAVPLWALAAAVGSWYLYRSGSANPARRYFSIVLILAFAIMTAIVGFLLAFTGAGARLDDLNLSMYQKIIELFSK